MTAVTKRPVVEALEQELGFQRPVLDHGYIQIVDYMGDDAAIVQAARVSYGPGTEHTRSERGLIRYLMSHAHTSPFEMCELKMQVKLPIFVARQWLRHRMANVNEISARYSILDREFFLPELSQIATQSATNKQGRGGGLPEAIAVDMREQMARQNNASHLTYEYLLADGDGMARELARTVLPLSTYTTMVWKIDLHNLLNFLQLRIDAHAQAEIRAYAEVLAELVDRWVPLAWEAFRDYRMLAETFSRQQLTALMLVVGGHISLGDVDWQALGMTRREWTHLCTAMNQPVPE